MIRCDMIAETVRDLVTLAAQAPFKRFNPSVPVETPIIENEASADKVKSTNLEWEAHLQLMKDKWAFIASRFEAILQSNNTALHNPNKSGKLVSKPQDNTTDASIKSVDDKVFMVGRSMTYADILVAHIMTWFVEECGESIAEPFPYLVTLQNQVISSPGIRKYIQSVHYFPIGDDAYVMQVKKILNR